MTTQQIESPQDEDDEQTVVSVEKLERDDELVLELLKDLDGQALTKGEIAERLGWDNSYRVSTTQTDIVGWEFHKVSSRYYDGTRYYYAEVDWFKVAFAIGIPLFVLFFAGIMMAEYGLI